jgi:hypothetical protein
MPQVSASGNAKTGWISEGSLALAPSSNWLQTAGRAWDFRSSQEGRRGMERGERRERGALDR